MKLLKNIICALIGLLAVTSCVDQVSDPMQTLSLDLERIVVPYAQTATQLTVNSNTKWIANLSPEANTWIVLSTLKETGTRPLTLTFTRNGGDDNRTATLTLACETNPNVQRQIQIVQRPASEEGFIAIGELQELLGDRERYVIKEDLRIRGFISTSVADNNFIDNMLAIQSCEKTTYGAVCVRFSQTPYYVMGDEVEVRLKDALIERDPTHDLLVVKPVADNYVQCTETTRTQLEAKTLSYDELQSGEWQGMFVTLDEPLEITLEGIYKTLSEDLIVEDASARLNLPLWVRESSIFAGTQPPIGSGALRGIAVRYNGCYTIMPRIESDIDFLGTRFFGMGVSLPQIISLMHNGTATTAKAGDLKHSKTSWDWQSLDGLYNDEANSAYIEPNDASGAKLGAALYQSASTRRVIVSTANSGHFKFAVRGWASDAANYDKAYIRVTYPGVKTPIGQGDKLRFSFGACSDNGPKAFDVYYAIGDEEYTKIGDFEMTMNEGGGKGYYYLCYNFTADKSFPLGVTVTFKIQPTTNQTVSGTTATGYGMLHSCVLFEKIEPQMTTAPDGVILFEGFDALTEGLDYVKWGDQLSAMTNFCGGVAASLLPNFTCTNIHQRPGYAQVGFVDSQWTANDSYVHQAGALTTPPLAALERTSDVRLTFRAAGYHTGAFNRYVSDKDGDRIDFVVRVDNGGTINGHSSETLTGLSYTAFEGYVVDIKNATPATTITFAASTTDAKTFARWFIDDICVKKL